MYIQSTIKGEAISHVFEEIGVIYDMPLRVGEHLVSVGKAVPATKEEYLAQCERYQLANAAAAALGDETAEVERKTADPKRKSSTETR